MSEIKKVFKKEGTKIVLKQEIPKIELTSKDILFAIGQDKCELEKQKTQKAQVESQLPMFDENIKNIEENLKKITKFEDWATEIQVSKLKAIANEIKNEVEKKVKDGYEFDDTLTEEQNKIQMFCQYKGYIQRHEKVNKEIFSTVIMSETTKKGYLVNPF